MNVIVPLGGLGTRFQKQGYTRPKPFIRVLGKEMILWVLDSLCLTKEDTLVIVFNPDFMCMGGLMEEVVLPRYPACKLVHLTGPTKGAAETVLIGLQALRESLKANRPCVLCDGDTFYTADVVGKYRPVGAARSNGTFVFEDKRPEPIYSYVRPQQGTDYVEEIKEKVKISDHANSGCYCFRDSKELESYCDKVLRNCSAQLNQDSNKEYYISGVIKHMLDDRIPCRMLQLERSSIHVLGTPAQVQEFSEARKVPAPKAHVVVHFEDAILPLLQRQAAGESASSGGGLLPYLRCVHRIGGSITIATSQAKESASSAASGGEGLESTLARHHIPWDSLQFSSPAGLFMIGPRAVDCSLAELDKELGFYFTEAELSETNGQRKRQPGPGTNTEEERQAKRPRQSISDAAEGTRQEGPPQSSLSERCLIFGAGFLAGAATGMWRCWT
mmetsp:Transcript_67548/g.162165  ORF Transcript_67548/g.162165 Transcript_67548/m.162165 type:complete len:444 (-) Transcript_67548:140-1471(-)